MYLYAYKVSERFIQTCKNEALLPNHTHTTHTHTHIYIYISKKGINSFFFTFIILNLSHLECP